VPAEAMKKPRLAKRLQAARRSGAGQPAGIRNLVFGDSSQVGLLRLQPCGRDGTVTRIPQGIDDAVLGE